MLTNVLAEEVAKRRFGVLPLVLAEGFAHYRQGRLCQYIPTGVMHYAWARMPLWCGVLCHYIFNIGASVPGRLLDSLWSLKQGDVAKPVPAICVGETGDKWDAKAQTASVSKFTPFPCEPRIALWPCGPNIFGSTPYIFRSCGCNEYAAVCSRVCAGRQPWDGNVAANRDVWRGTSPFFLGLFREFGMAGIAEYPEDQIFETWVSRYTLHVRNRLRLVRTDVEDRDLTSRELRVKAFIKVERLPSYLPVTGFEMKKPRLIQGRSDAAKVVMGPFFYYMGKLLCDVWNCEQSVYYPGRGDSNELGHWAHECELAGLIPFSFDVSAFDSCVGPGPTLQWVNFVRSFPSCPKSLRKFLLTRLQIQKGRTGHGVRYERVAQVSSGDGDTTLANTVIHGIGWKYVMKRLGIPRYRVVVLGDDSVVAIPKSHTNKVEQFLTEWRRLGFLMEPGPSRNWNRVEFCSGLFWDRGNTRIFGPTPWRVLSKTFWSIHNLKPKKMLRYLRGVVLSLESRCSHVPLLSELVQRLKTLTRGLRPIVYGAKDRIEFKTQGVLRPNDYSVLQFCEVVGCDGPALNRALREIHNITEVCHTFKSSFFERLAELAAG